jgi:glutathione S-transferase
MTADPTITLYCFGPFFGLPDPSPFVMKSEIQLKMAGRPYRKAPGRLDAAPKGKLPYIEDAGETVADSTFIRVHLERKYRVDLDDGLGGAERALAWTIERLLEDHLYWAILQARWMVPENFAKGPARFFDALPEAVRAEVREQTRQKVAGRLDAHGMGRNSSEEVAELGGRSLAALSALLGDKPYVTGDRPCGADATAFAMLAGTLTPFFDSELRRRAAALPNLPAYVDRLMKRYYPDHPWG